MNNEELKPEVKVEEPKPAEVNPLSPRQHQQVLELLIDQLDGFKPDEFLKACDFDPEDYVKVRDFDPDDYVKERDLDLDNYVEQREFQNYEDTVNELEEKFEKLDEKMAALEALLPLARMLRDIQNEAMRTMTMDMVPKALVERIREEARKALIKELQGASK